MSQMAYGTYLDLKTLLFILNPNLTGCPVFYLAILLLSTVKMLLRELELPCTDLLEPITGSADPPLECVPVKFSTRLCYTGSPTACWWHPRHCNGERMGTV